MHVDTAAKRLLFHTVRVDTVLADGSLGSGTAFVIEHPHARGRSRFVVTNRHLVEGVQRGALVFTRAHNGQPLIGQRFQIDIEDFPQAWFCHPQPEVDLALVPLRPLLEAAQAQGVELYVQPIDSRTMPDAAASAAFDALEDVLFVGYPSGVWDQVNALPILRRGSTATALALDFEGRAEFLIDAAVYPGSSGSPVFVRRRRSDGAPDDASQSAPWFAGVVAAVFFREEASRLVPVPVPASVGGTVLGSEMIDLGLVIKASAVQELLAAYLGRWLD